MNAHSIVARKPELEHFLSTQSNLPDVICVQESLLNRNIPFNIAGYRTERNDRESGRGGGVATFIRSNLSYTRLPNPTSLEALVIRVKLQSGDKTLVNVYHTPNSQLNEEAYRQLFQLFSLDAIILGDLNAHSYLFGVAKSDSRGRLLEDLIENHNMVVLNTGAGTYVHHSGVISHLDVAMIPWVVIICQLSSNFVIQLCDRILQCHTGHIAELVGISSKPTAND